MERLEEFRANTKGVSLVAKGSGEEDGTYQIWSSTSNDEEMQNPTHSAMYANFEKGSVKEGMVTGKCFSTTSDDKSPMTSKIRTLLEYFEIPFSSYDAILSDFDNTISCFNDILISFSCDTKNQNPYY